jgi:hypothetical protein
MDKAAVQEILRQDLVNAIRSAQFEGESEIAARLIAIASVIPPAGAVSPWLEVEPRQAPFGVRMTRLWQKSVGRYTSALTRGALTRGALTRGALTRGALQRGVAAPDLPSGQK